MILRKEERQGERERERERLICCSTYSVVDSCRCPDQNRTCNTGFNQRATWPGIFYILLTVGHSLYMSNISKDSSRPPLPQYILWMTFLIFCKKDLFLWASSHSGILFSSLLLIKGIYQIHWLSSSLISLVQCSVFSFFPKSYHSELPQCLDRHVIKLETSQWLSPLLYQDTLTNTKKLHHYQMKYLNILLYGYSFPNFQFFYPVTLIQIFSHWDPLSLDPTKLSLSIIPSF